MLGPILVSGLATGAVYALIGVTYNVMFSASRVMSFTAGQLGMLGGVLGAWFILQLGLPWPLGLLLTLAVCSLVGVVTEIWRCGRCWARWSSTSTCSLHSRWR